MCVGASMKNKSYCVCCDEAFEDNYNPTNDVWNCTICSMQSNNATTLKTFKAVFRNDQERFTAEIPNTLLDQMQITSPRDLLTGDMYQITFDEDIVINMERVSK